MSSEWILVKDKLPQLFGRYWITVKIGNQYVTKESDYIPSTQRWIGFFNNDVISWQEQPTPYSPTSKRDWKLVKDGLPTFAAKYWVTTDHLILTTAYLFEAFDYVYNWHIETHSHVRQKVIAWQEYEVPDPYIPAPIKLYLVSFYTGGWRSQVVYAEKDMESVYNVFRKPNSIDPLPVIKEIGIAHPEISKAGMIEIR